MLEKVKLALRITTDAFNEELTDLMVRALRDMNLAGVEVVYDENEEWSYVINEEMLNELDPLVSFAVITYCKMNFGLPEDYDRLKRSYDEQKAQLVTATGYTDWLVD